MESIGIIIPSWKYFQNPWKLQPLMELFFATIIEEYFKDKVNIKIMDFRKIRKQENVSIEECALYFYWIMKVADFNEISEISLYIRKLFPKSKHISGGTFVEIFPDRSKVLFDSIIVGAGEKAIINAISDVFNNDLKDRYNEDWKKSNYDSFPFSKREYLPKEDIVNTELFEKYGSVLGTSVMFSRGCSFKCAFCSYNIPSFMQRRSPENIFKEIMYLKEKYNIQALNLRDEMCIPFHQEIAYPFLNVLKSFNIIWRGQSRIGINESIMKAAKKSGCVELALGVESVSQQVLDIINKKQKIEDVIKFFKICKGLDIKTKMCLILGLPGEPRDIVDLTKKFIEDVKPDYVNISGFCPMPGAEIYNNPSKFCIKNLESDFSKYFHLMCRFEDEEDFGLPFEYEENTKWGKSFTRNEILNNIKELQNFARERDMVY